MIVIHAVDQADLDRVSALVHDQWFDLDDLTFDQAARKLRMRLYEGHPRRARPERGPARRRSARSTTASHAIGEIVIGHVVEWTVDDYRAAVLDAFDTSGCQEVSS